MSGWKGIIGGLSKAIGAAVLAAASAELARQTADGVKKRIRKEEDADAADPLGETAVADALGALRTEARAQRERAERLEDELRQLRALLESTLLEPAPPGSAGSADARTDDAQTDDAQTPPD